MKLEYLSAGSPDCPLIRLYDFSSAEAGELFKAVTQLANGSCQAIDVHRLPFVESIRGCQLSFVARLWDQSTLRVATPATFECGFTRDSWDNLADLVEPFASGAGGFQWLAGVPGDTALLISVNGQW